MSTYLFIYLFKIMHLIIIFFQYMGPYVFNDSKILAFLVILNMLMLIQWYGMKTNLFILVENEYEKTDYKFDNGFSKSIFVNQLEKFLNIDNMILFYAIIAIPGINVMVSLDKILNNCSK